MTDHKDSTPPPTASQVAGGAGKDDSSDENMDEIVHNPQKQEPKANTTSMSSLDKIVAAAAGAHATKGQEQANGDVTKQKEEMSKTKNAPKEENVAMDKAELSTTTELQEEVFEDEFYEENADVLPPRRRRRTRRRHGNKQAPLQIEDSTPETLKRRTIKSMASKATKWATDRKTKKRPQLQHNDPTTTTSQDTRPRNNTLTEQEMEICAKLDLEYERALEEREVGYAARYASVRQSACLSVSFMLIYLTVGTTYYLQLTDDYELHEALLFLMYTITTVGYGTIQLPETVAFQLFTIVYIFVGIATLTIMVAQCYQWIALEATRAQHARDKADLAQRGKELLLDVSQSGGGSSHATSRVALFPQEAVSSTRCDVCMAWWTNCRTFFREHHIGKSVSVLIPFASLIVLGAAVVGPIEGWTVVESLYFAVVSLTTVGFGDYVPTRQASIWFTICWLPFSIGFMSLFLSNVASFYIRLSDKNIARLEQLERRNLQKEKDLLERERNEARKRALRGQAQVDDSMEATMDHEIGLNTTSSDDVSIDTRTPKKVRKKKKGFATLPMGDDESDDDESVVAAATADPVLFGSPESVESLGQIRREVIMSKSRYRYSSKQEQSSMSTMKHVIDTVRENVASDADSLMSKSSARLLNSAKNKATNSNVLLRNSLVTTAASSTPAGGLFHKKPSFALRVLVQERFAEIIAIDVAGFQSNIEIQDMTLSVTIDSLDGTADKWLIPRRARKAFRAVAFECLLFVGEHGLITRGADALFDLTPFEFHGLFSPLVAAMGDADTMNGWLASTDVLAEVDLRRDSSFRNSSQEEDSALSEMSLAQQSYSQRLRLVREQEEAKRQQRKSWSDDTLDNKLPSIT